MLLNKIIPPSPEGSTGWLLLWIIGAAPFITLLLCLTAQAEETRTINDALGRNVTIPANVDKVICSGPGCLRLLTYLQAQDMVVAVDSIEVRSSQMDARPYALANRQFKQLPVFGEFRGKDDPERILSLEHQPQVIFKTFARVIGYDPDALQNKTGIPVLALNYGDLSTLLPDLDKSLRLMGEVLGRERRAEEVISFFEDSIADLKQRTKDSVGAKQPGVFVGGISFKGAHGFQSTEPLYQPFVFVHARNLAGEQSQSRHELRTANISKEQIVTWDPDILFLDLATLQMGEKAGGLHELRTDPAYRSLTAVQNGKVYGLLPYNWYTKNFGSILANGYFIGKVLQPERFSDIDPVAKADAIYSFLVGKPVYKEMNAMFKNLAFSAISLN